jgi:hypothetical protein
MMTDEDEWLRELVKQIRKLRSLLDEERAVRLQIDALLRAAGLELPEPLELEGSQVRSTPTKNTKETGRVT